MFMSLSVEFLRLSQQPHIHVRVPRESEVGGFFLEME